MELIVGLGVVHAHPRRHGRIPHAKSLAQMQHRQVREVRHSRDRLEHVEAGKVVVLVDDVNRTFDRVDQRLVERK